MVRKMSERLEDLLRDRFADHEVPVDPGMWAAIHARLAPAAAPADHTDPVSDLLRERFKDHEVPVDPAAWQAIESRIATSGGWKTWAGRAAVVAGVLGIWAGARWMRADETPARVEERTAAPVETPQRAEQPLPEAREAALPVVVPEHTSEPIAAAAEEPPHTAQAPAERTEDRIASTMPEANAPLEPITPLTQPAQQETPAPLPAPAPDPVGQAVVERVIAEMAQAAEQQARKVDKVVPVEEPALEPAAEEDPWRTDEPKLYLPGIFTPNGDGVNDLYEVVGEGFDQIRMRVYAIRTNELVFATNSGEPWNGAGSPDGHYVVAVEAVTTDGRIITESKVVWLARSH
jgi:hypothetical protein